MAKAKVSKSVRIRYPHCFEIGNDSIVDDFCYFSTKMTIGRYCHIANNVSVAGGDSFTFSMGDFSSVSSGVRIWVSSNDYTNGLVCLDASGPTISGDVVLEKLTGIGSNSVIMPDVRVPIGTVIGAMSFVPTGCILEEWTVYAGIPVKKIASRNRNAVLDQLDQFQVSRRVQT